MKFSYTALSSDNKEVSGVLTAPNIDAAKEELHKMALSILSVEEISEEAYRQKKQAEAKEKAEKGIITYSFKGSDGEGKPVEGTIDAPEPYTAYKRLIREYEFTVDQLYRAGASDEEKEAATKMLPSFEKKLEGETPTEKEAEEAAEDYSETDRKINQELVKEIDKVIDYSKKVMQGHRDLFSVEKFEDIEKTLGELERIRTSNNINHISEVSAKLYKLVSDPDLLKKDELKSKPAYQKLVADMGQNKVIKKDTSLRKKEFEMKSILDTFNRVKKRLKKLITKPPATLAEKPEAKSPGILQKITSIFPAKKTSKTPSGFFFELSSFVGWLLAFYLMYFYLADASLEKSVGLPPEFVIRTLKSPLILNITILLVFAQLILRIKNKHFYGNFLGSTFLFFFGFGLYALLMLNA